MIARRPHPNKNYLVAQRNKGRKAIIGILLETERSLDSFTVTTRWAVNAEQVITHEVEYLVLDHTNDLVSEYMVLWNAFVQNGQSYASRWPEWAECLSDMNSLLCALWNENVYPRGNEHRRWIIDLLFESIRIQDGHQL